MFCSAAGCYTDKRRLKAKIFAYFCPRRFVVLRVEMRGTGSSEGRCYGEYLPQEQRDCEEVLMTEEIKIVDTKENKSFTKSTVHQVQVLVVLGLS